MFMSTRLIENWEHNCRVSQKLSNLIWVYRRGHLISPHFWLFHNSEWNLPIAESHFRFNLPFLRLLNPYLSPELQCIKVKVTQLRLWICVSTNLFSLDRYFFEEKAGRVTWNRNKSRKSRLIRWTFAFHSKVIRADMKKKKNSFYLRTRIQNIIIIWEKNHDLGEFLHPKIPSLIWSKNKKKKKEKKSWSTFWFLSWPNHYPLCFWHFPLSGEKIK
jgi:hypothetical protein